jgi:hypothetical protein
MRTRRSSFLVASRGVVRSTPLLAPRTCRSTIGCPSPVESFPRLAFRSRRSMAGKTEMKSLPPSFVWAKDWRSFSRRDFCDWGR